MVETWICEHNKGILGTAPPLCFPFCRSAVLHLPEVWQHHANMWVQYQETASHQLRGDAKGDQFSEDMKHELGDVCLHPPSPRCCTCAQGVSHCSEEPGAELQGEQVQGLSSETIPLAFQLGLISLILSSAACWNHREQSTFSFCCVLMKQGVIITNIYPRGRQITSPSPFLERKS